MNSWAPANQIVERLERELPGLDPLSKIDSAVGKYARHTLSRLTPGVALPSDGSDLTEQTALVLLNGFRDQICFDSSNPKKIILTNGQVAINFSCLVHFIVGRATRDLTDLQCRILLNACNIAEERKLPVLRWTDFVRRHLFDPARLQAATKFLLYSVVLLDVRIPDVFGQLHEKLELTDGARVLAVGSSATVFHAIGGLARQRKLEVFVTRPTRGMPIDSRRLGFEADVIGEDEISKLHYERNFDLALIGCGVIGKTKENPLEVVNWAADVSVAKRFCSEKQVPLVAVGGLYKIWTQDFYVPFRDQALQLAAGKFPPEEAVLTHRDLDWLVTEHEAVNFAEGKPPEWVKFLLEAHSLEVPSTIVCLHKIKLIKDAIAKQSLHWIDAELGSLEDFFKDDCVPHLLMYPQRTNPNIIIDELYKNLSARYSQEGIDQGIDNAITALRDVLLCRLDAKDIVTLVMREAVSKSSSHSSQENRTALKILYHALERTGLDQFRPLCAYLLGSLSENLGEMSAAESYYLGALEEALAQQNKKIAQQSATELARISGLPEFGAIDKQGGKRGAERAERRGRST